MQLNIWLLSIHPAFNLPPPRSSRIPPSTLPPLALRRKVPDLNPEMRAFIYGFGINSSAFLKRQGDSRRFIIKSCSMLRNR